MNHALPALILATSIVALAALTPGSAAARDRNRPERIVVRADVIDVRPVYRQVRFTEPRRECWTEEVRHVVREGRTGHDNGYREGRRGSGDGGAVVGGLIGGVVGNQLGRRGSSGERAGATIAGAIVGSVIGNESSSGSARHRRHRRSEAARTVYETRPVERCRTVEGSRSERRLQHYDVTYSYEGRTYTTRLPRDPGPTLELNVTLTPARR